MAGLCRAVLVLLMAMMVLSFEPSISFANDLFPDSSEKPDPVSSAKIPQLQKATTRAEAKKAEAKVIDGYKIHEDEKKDKDEDKEGKEKPVKGTTVNGQQLYKQTVEGKEYQYYYSTGEKSSQFISQMQPDGSFKQTTMDAMLGRGGENGMRPIGSIETSNGKLAAMYTMDGAPGSKAFFDGESWHIQGQGADSFTVTKGSSIPGEYAEITSGFDGAKAPLENLPEGWSRGGSEVFKGGSPEAVSGAGARPSAGSASGPSITDKGMGGGSQGPSTGGSFPSDGGAPSLNPFGVTETINGKTGTYLPASPGATHTSEFGGSGRLHGTFQEVDLMGRPVGSTKYIYSNDAWAKANGKPAPVKICGGGSCQNVSPEVAARLGINP